jgi:hypothetical protein
MNLVPLDTRPDADQMISCPSCGDTSSIDRWPPTGKDHEAVTVHPDADRYDSPIGTRGGYVQIDLVCGCGQLFALVIGNHKGAEIMNLALRNGDGSWTNDRSAGKS